MEERLPDNLHRLHTTALGAARIQRNLSLHAPDVIEWCRAAVRSPDAVIERRGKNWYVYTGGCVLTVHVGSYTVITAHRALPTEKTVESC